MSTSRQREPGLGQRPELSGPLAEAWSEAFERMDSAAPQLETNFVLNLTAAVDSPDILAQYRELHGDQLTPESVFFIEMSEAAKRDRPVEQ